MMDQQYPELQEFVLDNVSRTGVHLGMGSYGEVEELCWNGTKCAGKCLHESLMEQKSASSVMAEKFVSECKIIAKIRHPNIVQFLGLYFFPDYRNQNRLYLVMERLNDNLHNLVERKPNINLSVKCSILLDVSRGLVHLHSHTPSIVHRDLSTRNILLSASMQAKIADLGTARMIGSQKLSQRFQHTPVPGTLVFMPPEANTPKPLYDSKLDVFSFGQVMLHTLTQIFPYELLAPTYQSANGKVKGRSALEQRKEYMEILHAQLGKSHQLSVLTASCLHDLSLKRPTAKEAMSVLEAFHLELENSGKKYNAFSELSVIINADEVGNTGGVVREKGESRGAWDPELRKRSATFIESHILQGHPVVLRICQSTGKFRKNTEWREYVFKIVERKLQYHSLNNKKLGELPLAKVECAKAFWCPNSTDIFPFHVHFKGRGSPWILGAHTDEERKSWMEAIKPGSTLNQWVRQPPNKRNTVYMASQNTTGSRSSQDAESKPPSEEHSPPPELPPRANERLRSIDLPSPEIHVSEKQKANDATPPKVPPRFALPLGIEDSLNLPTINTSDQSFRPKYSSQSSDCTYIPAYMLNTYIAPKSDEDAEQPPAVVEADGDFPQQQQPDNIYLPILATLDEKSLSGKDLEDMVIRQLREQFDPVQVDLLIQMFQTWLKPQPEDEQQQQQSSPSMERKASHSSTKLSNTLTVPDSPSGNTHHRKLTHRHIGYAKEGQEDPYSTLADIAVKLNKMQNSGKKEEEKATKRKSLTIPRSKHSGVYITLGELFDDRKVDTSARESLEGEELDRNVDTPSSAYLLQRRNALSPSRLSRKNAVRAPRPRSASESKASESRDEQPEQESKEPAQNEEAKPVLKLKSILRQASTDDMLEDAESSNFPEWSKANATAVDPSEIPKPNRLSTFCDVVGGDLFLSKEDLVGFQVISGGQYGQVFRAYRRTESADIPVALKPIKSRLSSGNDVTNFLQEMAILKCVRHPNVAQVYGLVNEANWIVMEYMLNGDLKSYLSSTKTTVSQLLKFMLDVSMGMHYLSAKGFIHKKLAARNILVSESKVCKVADLELGSQSTSWLKNATATTTTTSGEEEENDPFNILRWMAPECLQHQTFSAASDVWSYGVVAWEMFHPDQTPYEDCEDKVFIDRVLKGYVLDIPRVEGCPERVGKIMKACWYQNPASRPSFLYISSLLNSITIDLNKF